MSDPRAASSSTIAGASTVDDDRGPLAPSAPRRGQAIGRYLTLELLGRGGMGVVMAAYDPELDRRVAIKLLDRPGGGDERQRRLVREAQAMARLSHPNVVPVFDAGTIDGAVFVTMELCRGGTLTRWLRAEPRPWRAVLDAFLEAGRGLTAAHAAGMIHRDFKPDNVLRTEDGTFKVSDFGLVAVAGDAPRTPAQAAVVDRDDLTRTGAVLGTPRYMAPEQWSGGTVDARTDQFAFCSALFEALWPGRVAPGATFAALAAADELDPPGKDDPVPIAIQAAVVRGLALAPRDRHASMIDLARALVIAPPRRRYWLAGGAIALGAIGLATMALRGGTSAPTCPLPPADLDGAWTEPTRAGLRTSFVRTGASFAAAAADDVIGSLDRYAQDWAVASRDACRSARAIGHDGAQAAHRRLACVGRRRDVAQALIRELVERADAAALTAAPIAIARLPALADCADADLLSRRPTPAPAVAGLVDATTRDLAAVNAQLAAGHYDAAAAALPPLIERAARLEYTPLWIEAMLARAEVHGGAGEVSAARADLYDAAGQARRLGLDDLEATAWARLANGERFGDDHLAAAAAAQQAGAIARRRDDARAVTEALLLEIRARAELGDVETARLRLAEVAPRIPQSGDDWRLGVRWAIARATVATAAGDVATALAADHEAHAAYVAHLGPEHPELAYVEVRLSTDASLLGRLDEAGTWLERARARTQATDPRDLLPALIAINAATLATRDGGDPRPELDRARSLLAATVSTSPLAIQLTLVEGVAAFQAGDLRTAAAHFRDALAHAHGQKRVVEANAADNLAMTLTLLGELAEAETVARRALALRSAPGADPVLAALARGTLARIVSSSGRPDEAEPLFVEALAALDLGFAPRAPAIAELVIAHAVNLEQLGREAEAAALVAPAVPILRAAGNDYYLGLALMFHADDRWRAGDRAAAHVAAVAARDALIREGDSPDELAELAAWVRAHPAPRQR